MTTTRCLDASCTDSLVSATKYVDGDPNKVELVTHADGTQDDYSYDEVGFSLTAGVPSINSGGSGFEETRIERLNASGQSVADKSTASVSIIDGRGRTVYAASQAYSNSAWTTTEWTAWDYAENGLNETITTYRSDGTSAVRVQQDCCGSSTTTSADGVVTTTATDVLDRPVTVTRSAVPGDSGQGLAAQAEIVTTYDYDVANGLRITTTTTDVTGDTLSTTSAQAVDLAGRMAYEQTGTGTEALKTLYAYGATPQGGRTVTVYERYPEAATSGTAGLRDRTMAYYVDGRTKSVTGSTVVSTYYHYDAVAGETSTEVRTGTDTQTRYTKTTYDMLGRTKQEQQPGWTDSGTVTLTTKSFYDSDGRLEKVEPSHDPNTLYVYDVLGNATRTGLDLDGDDALTLSSTDRITDSDTVFGDPDSTGELWAVTTEKVYPTDNDATAVTTRTVKRQLTGLGTGGLLGKTLSVDAAGAVTEQSTTRTVISGGAADGYAYRTNTSIARDGSKRVSVSYAGRAQKVESRDSSDTVVDSTTYGYDGLGRQNAITDGRGQTSTTEYDALGRAWKTSDAAGKQTVYAYYSAPGYASRGRLYLVLNPNFKFTYYEYNARGQATHTWGQVPQPTLVSYDPNYGDRVSLTTFQDDTINFATGTWPAGVDAADGQTTTWDYHLPTGLLETKTYADPNSVVDYTYTAEGQLYEREWAREHNSNRLKTTYAYTDAGELSSVTYSDDTPDVTFTYTRLGYPHTVTDALGQRTFAYDASTLAQTTETFDAGNLLDGKVITQVYDKFDAADAYVSRFAGLQVGTADDADANYAAAYGYDAAGRLNVATGPGLPAGGATYAFDPNISLVNALAFKDNDTPANVLVQTEWTYDPNRPLVTAVEHTWDPAGDDVQISRYGYELDSLSRRYVKQRQGLAFAADYFEGYTYNDRSELTGSSHFDGVFPGGAADPNFDRAWTYDPIGNRKTFEIGDDAPRWEYGVNDLNQYADADAFRDASVWAQARRLFEYDLDGDLTHTLLMGDANCDGVVDTYDIDALILAMSNLASYKATYPGCDPNLLDCDDSGVVDTYDIDCAVQLFTGGGEGAGPAMQFSYDAENRLIAAEPAFPNASSEKVEFAYDYMGRRVQKQVFGYDSTNDVWLTTPKRERRFMYADWRPVLELDGSNDVIRKYTWGRDLSGSLDAAGGIGGLVAIEDPDDLSDPADPHGAFWVFYDANGNVGQLIDSAASVGGVLDYGWHADRIAAHYEYTPYGQVRSSSGTYASENPMRFSTKYWDDETGLGYWGYRYYDPAMGRWVNRDPIEEAGGLNLYAYVLNDPTAQIDPHGLCGTCGPDITDALKKMRRTIESQFQAMSRKKKKSVCKKIYDAAGWDINQLYAPTLNEDGCPSCEGCEETVTVDGRCFNAKEVNYYLWGTVNKECGYSLNKAQDSVFLWKAVRYGVLRTGAVAWTERGYKNKWPPQRVLGTLKCDPCKKRTSETLKGHYGGMRFGWPALTTQPSPPTTQPSPPAAPTPTPEESSVHTVSWL